MNIIFGDIPPELRQKHVVLELDTFTLPDGIDVTAHAVIENMPLINFPVLSQFMQAHSDMMQAYRQQNWEYCTSIINGLLGQWDNEMDTFYQDLLERIQRLQQDPPTEWDPKLRVNSDSGKI